jgi:antitoxin YobK
MTTVYDVEEFVRQNKGICDAGRPASDELINKAERFLDLRFPNDYREFLKRWGTLAIGPLEFYGITGDTFESSSVPNAIWFTAVKRQQLGLPKELVILYDNNGVEYYCLDTSHAEKSRVVAWDNRARQIGAVKSDSLFDFILNESADSV